MVNVALLALSIFLVLAPISCVQSSPSQPSVGSSVADSVGGQGQENHETSTGSISNSQTFRNWATGFQALATLVAVVVGGWFAWRNRHLFRYGQPHLTIGHEISHRQVSPGYVQVTVTAILHNSSRVKVEVLDGLLTIQQMSPVSDSDAEEIFAETFIDRKHNGTLQWDTLTQFRLSWNQEDLIAEPGESATATFEYMVPIYIESLLVTTYFYNAKVMGKIEEGIKPLDAERRKRWLLWRQPGPRGWIRTTPHDIILMSRAQDSDGSGA